MGRLDGKVALITGGGSGMGREACLVLAREGARIAALDLDAAGLEATASMVRDAGGEIATFVADVADERQVREAIEGAVRRFGAVHILYNNAGVLWRDRDVSVLETDESVWDRVMAINLKGMVWVCKHGIPKLIAAGGGAVVNIGSTSALLGDTIPQDAYTASKGAVISLTRNLAVQFAPHGIRANCIHPGFTDTPMQGRADLRPRVGGGRARLDPAREAGDPPRRRERCAVPRERRGLLHHGRRAHRRRRQHDRVMGRES
ncbi:MAG TPA: SDR family oxidoreductase [Actinomycetota bacterium]